MKLDTFVNTKQKRHYVFVIVTLLLVLKLLFVYGALASRLISLTTYSDVFNLLDMNEISWTYISRIILSLISKAQPNVSTVIIALLQAIRIDGIVTILCLFVLLYGWRHRHPILLRFIGISFAITLLASMVFLYQGFQSTTLMEVVDVLHIIGFIILLACITYGFLCVYGCIQTMYCYKDVYEIEVIEIEQRDQEDKQRKDV